jgi:hypothetical protein
MLQQLAVCGQDYADRAGCHSLLVDPLRRQGGSIRPTPYPTIERWAGVTGKRPCNHHFRVALLGV